MLVNQSNALNLEDFPRVLFVYQGSLLDDCVMSLVGSNTEFEVLKINYVSDELLARHIAKNCPDVIMMGQKQTGKMKSLFRFLTGSPALEKLRMVVFHTDDNCVDVYSRKQMCVLPSRDFLTIIQREHATF